MALQPFSTLATYAPEGDQDTELMAELQEQEEKKIFKLCHQAGSIDKNRILVHRSPFKPDKRSTDSLVLIC